AVSVLAELMAVAVMYVACRKSRLLPGVWDRNLKKILAVSLAVFALAFALSYGAVYSTVVLVAVSVLFFSVYFGLLALLGEKNTLSVYSFVKSKLSNSNARL